MGIPVNTTGEEFNQAFEKAMTLFPKERLVEKPELSERVNEIRDAHKVLGNTETRQAHDRKLNAAVQSPAANWKPTKTHP